MNYYSIIKKIDNSYIVSFPDFPNIQTYGDTLEQALIYASEALNGTLESDFQRGFKITEPSIPKSKKRYPIKVLPHITIALQLRKLRNNKSQVDIAKKLGISYQAYQKLENPRKCNPTVKSLEKIMKVFNKELDFVIN